MIDKIELRKWWDVFVGDGNFTEVRILGKFQYSGYFKSFENLCKQLEPYTEMDDEQIYFVLNRIDKSCYARPQCEKFIKSVKVSTNDNDIISRRFVMIDCDPIRKSSVNSSESEFNCAMQKARDIFRFLRDNGFEEPIVCHSGNGTHLQLLVDLPNDEETTNILKRFYQYLGQKFTDENVDIDQKVFNLGRLCKTYSTMAKKGANLLYRPWRQSKILYIPKELKKTSIEKFKAIADLLPKEEPKVAPNRQRAIYNTNNPFDLRTWLNEHAIVYKEETNGNGTKFILEHCPWEDTHSSKQKWDSALFLASDGQITFNCFHSHCKDKTWFDVRTFYEPDAYNRPAYQPQVVYVKQPTTPQKPKYEIKDEMPELGEKWLSMSSIKKVDISALEHVKTGFNELDKNIIGLYMSEVTILSGSNACVDCETEYFNGKQWKKISDFKIGERVLQYNADGSAELVIPQNYIKTPCKELFLLQSVTGVNQCVSENHDLVYMTSKGNIAKKSVSDMISAHIKSKKGFQGKFYTTFRYEQGNGIPMSDDEIRLMCAVISDGHFSNTFKDKNIVRFNLKKERKKERLEMLLHKCGISYRKEQYNPQDLQYNSYFFHAPKHEKKFEDYWYDCSAEQLSIVADEILYWDGYINNEKRHSSSYSSTSKRNIDFVQFAFASIGVRTSINIDDRVGERHSKSQYVYKNVCYNLTICRTKHPTLINPKEKKDFQKVKTRDGFKYCFTVPSGMLVLRRNGNINITGNSGKSSWLNTLILNIINQDKKVALWSGELRADILKAWMQMVAAGKYYLRPSSFGDGKYYVPTQIGERIDDWLNGKFFLYNNEYGAKWQQIFHDMELLIKIGVKVFVLDNLFSLDIDILEGDKNNKQRELILQIKEFAKKNQVHIILVAHPRKVTTFLRKNDISGSSDLQNAVDKIFIIHRVNNDFFRSGADYLGQSEIQRYQGFGNVIEVCKERMFGIVDLMVGLHYEVESRRFKNTMDENVHYGWEKTPTQAPIAFAQTAQQNTNNTQNDMPFAPPSETSAPF